VRQIGYDLFNFIFSFFRPDTYDSDITVQIGVATGPNNIFMQAYNKEIIPNPVFSITSQDEEGFQDMLIGGIGKKKCGNWRFHKQVGNWVIRVQEIGLNGMNRTDAAVVS
jgi:hypothetical protein